MFRIGTPELFLILLIILLLFGAKKLPEIAKALGKAIREFRKTAGQIKEEVEEKEDKE
ncbi:MAG TPA: twin-arginine translocase TatA/TatE family subunit [Candidatus Omnitrophica bacterium]|nr:twin-arginine translocase TatA/TatE family subunit [Candidatus Omnitrophota bacterium]